MDDDPSVEPQLEMELSIVEAALERKIQQPLTNVEVDGKLPNDLKGAIMMMAASYHATRENESVVQMYQIPGRYESLVTPFIKFKETNT